MRIVIQRVLSAAVDIAGKRKCEIGKGLLILVGVCDKDTDEAGCDKTATKRANKAAKDGCDKDTNETGARKTIMPTH